MSQPLVVDVSRAAFADVRRDLDLLRERGCHENLREQRIRIQRNRRDQVIQFLPE
jgi:hypothetical protein